MYVMGAHTGCVGVCLWCATGETDIMQLVGEAIHRIMLLAKEYGSEMMRPSSSSTSTSHNKQAADRKEESEAEREREEGHRDGGKVMCGGKEEKGSRGRTRKRACLVGQGGKGAERDCKELHSFNCALPVSDKSCVWQMALEREINQGQSVPKCVCMSTSYVHIVWVCLVRTRVGVYWYPHRVTLGFVIRFTFACTRVVKEGQILKYTQECLLLGR